MHWNADFQECHVLSEPLSRSHALKSRTLNRGKMWCSKFVWPTKLGCPSCLATFTSQVLYTVALLGQYTRTLTFHTLFDTGNTYVTVTGVYQFTDLRFERPGSGYALAFFLFDTSDVSVRDEESIDIISYSDTFGVGPAYSHLQINTRPTDMARLSQPKP
jgi:hypothetical protein